jgi:hypothetical protein
MALFALHDWTPWAPSEALRLYISLCMMIDSPQIEHTYTDLQSCRCRRFRTLDRLSAAIDLDRSFSLQCFPIGKTRPVGALFVSEHQLAVSVSIVGRNASDLLQRVEAAFQFNFTYGYGYVVHKSTATTSCNFIYGIEEISDPLDIRRSLQPNTAMKRWGRAFYDPEKSYLKTRMRNYFDINIVTPAHVRSFREFAGFRDLERDGCVQVRPVLGGLTALWSSADARMRAKRWFNEAGLLLAAD